MKSVSVQCGSSPAASPSLIAAAADIGKVLAAMDMRVVYGGVRTGLMGSLADSVLEHGGQVTGVVPQFLVDEGLAHEGLSELRIVASMSDRKNLMLDLSDATVVLPGGVGTMDEFWEVLAGAQLGLHSKPCGILNVNGYYDPLLAFVDRALVEGLLSATDKGNVIVNGNPEALLSGLSQLVAGRLAASKSQ